MQSETFYVQKGETYFIPLPDYAINDRLTPFISMQNHYNLIYREEEREMIPTLKVYDLPPVAQSFSAPLLPALWHRFDAVVSVGPRRSHTAPWGA
jgi:hypothetical protein